MRCLFVAFVLWTPVFVLFALHTSWSGAVNGQPVPLLQAFGWSAAEWYTWALLTPLLLLLTARVPLRDRWDARLLAYIPAAICFIVAQATLEWVVDLALVRGLGEASIGAWLARRATTQPAQWSYLVQRKAGFNLAVFVVIVLLANGWGIARESRERALASAQLQSELLRARLALLRSQVNPHFLFNTLNDIAALIHVEPHAADHMLTDLADLLRASLAAEHTLHVPLSDELALARAYLDVQRTRMGDRLRYRIDVADGIGEPAVPTLLLQPLLENAVRHGIDAVPAGGQITVRCRRDGARLAIDIVDDGAGLMSPSRRPGNGTGLANVRARLAAHYGDHASLQLAPYARGGTQVLLSLPAHDSRA